MNLLNLMVLNLEAEHTIAADHAIAVVSVQASELFTGAAIFRQAREVAQLVARLGELGIPASAIELEDARAEVENGMLSRTSSARYSLAVRCDPVDRLSELLAALAGQKNAALEQLRWGYAKLPEARRGWMEQLARDGNERAKVMARALGVELRGVHRFVEGGTEGPVAAFDDHLPAIRSGMSASKTRADLGFSLMHRKTVKIGATLELFIGSPPATVTPLKSV